MQRKDGSSPGSWGKLASANISQEDICSAIGKAFGAQMAELNMELTRTAAVRSEGYSNASFQARSDLDHPVEKLLKFLQEELKIVLRDWSQRRASGTVMSGQAHLPSQFSMA
ncbi:hypothetical protein H920_15565 [Fukomys damarensis]|uniref:Uncharacterized protein n=1 Tax=Fukomys damarensis TaxID=885580 RepID=A0A091CYT9_FUKDA|nr:hypothetical protein H920_15565 [Fukomys damarensis]